MTKHEFQGSLASFILRPSRANRSRELAEAFLGCLEVHAGVSDADAVLESFDVSNTRLELLVARLDVALDHDTHEAVLAVLKLLADRLANRRLILVILARVGVRHVNHHVWPQTSGFHLFADLIDGILVVVLAPHLPDLASTKDNVCHVVTLGVHDGREALLGDGQEAVRARGRHYGVDSNLDIAAGTVFETDRSGKSRDELSVDLAFGCPCTDGAPGDELGEVLRGHHVEELHSGWQAHLGELCEETTCKAQTLIDLEGAIEVRIVDETLPSNGGAWLLEVDAHDDVQVLLEVVPFSLQELGIVDGRLGIVNAARPNDDDETVITLGKDVCYGSTRFEYSFGNLIRARNLPVHAFWGKKGRDLADVNVVCPAVDAR
mmetsp:Transcript_14531/g.29380  ORF Transcript_14531/g.29380 Transcript_14531/m.29380 type:complete len:377 (+) Transcript_14531:256-1386(+)